MAQVIDLNELFSELGKDARSYQERANSARRKLSEAAVQLKHEIVRLTAIDYDALILRRDPHHSNGWNFKDILIGKKHGETDYGEPEPVVGIVTGIALQHDDNVHLIFIIPGDPNTYKVDAEDFQIEILDRFPDE